MRLGIDFGTTRTVVAAAAGNFPICAFDVDGQAREYLPSLVGLRDGRVCYGWEAASCLSEPGTHVHRSVKRLAATHGPEDLVTLAPGYALTLLDLLTGFLGHLREMIQTQSNLLGDRSVLEVMVATPANANSNQRYLTAEAFKGAGFVVLELMNESSAAAVEYVYRSLSSLGARSEVGGRPWKKGDSGKIWAFWEHCADLLRAWRNRLEFSWMAAPQQPGGARRGDNP